MPRNKEQSHERIIVAAKEEFLSCGFENASMRRIASSAGITVSGLYKHFPSKEEMFAALVQPMLDEFYALYRQKEQEENDAIMQIGSAAAFLNEDAVYVMAFIYDHLDAFRLLVCCSLLPAARMRYCPLRCGPVCWPGRREGPSFCLLTQNPQLR